MKFNDWLQKEELHEGKVGGMIGKAIGFGLPIAAGAWLTNLLMGTPAAGGLVGTATGALYGADSGTAIGDQIGDQIHKGYQKIRGIFSPKTPSAGEKYIDKLDAGRSLPADDIAITPKQVKQDKIADKSYFDQRKERDLAGKMLTVVLQKAGYSTQQIMKYGFNLGPNNEALTYWQMNVMKDVINAVKTQGEQAGQAVAKEGLDGLVKRKMIEPPIHTAKLIPNMPEPRTPPAEPESLSSFDNFVRKKPRKKHKSRPEQPELF